MISRRISEHVRTHNWFAVAIDLFVVILGVSVAGIETAALALRSNPGLLPALKLRFADVETAITDLETNSEGAGGPAVVQTRPAVTYFFGWSPPDQVRNSQRPFSLTSTSV